MRQIRRVQAAVNPADDTVPVDDGGTRQLRGVRHDRRLHVQLEAGRVRFGPPELERRVRLQAREIVLLEPHRGVARFRRIGNAARRVAESAAERVRLRAVADDDEAHLDAQRRELRIELAQLRERLTEERSTDVSQPDDERRAGQAEVGGGLRKRMTDVCTHPAARSRPDAKRPAVLTAGLAFGLIGISQRSSDG